MSEIKHTPGPWIMDCIPTSIGKCFRVGSEQQIQCGHGYICLYDDATSLNPNKNGETEANARLIAAAPELLEALLPFAKAYESLDSVGGGTVLKPEFKAQHFKAAIAAIAKATKSLYERNYTQSME